MPIKDRTIRLNPALAEPAVAALAGALSAVEGMMAVAAERQYLKLRYRLPETSLAEIIRIIDRRIEPPAFSRYNRLIYNFIAWLEANERDHLLGPELYQDTIDRVYQGFFDDRHSSRRDPRRQSWREYEK